MTLFMRHKESDRCRDILFQLLFVCCASLVFFGAFVACFVSCKSPGDGAAVKSEGEIEGSQNLGDFNSLIEGRFGLICGLLMSSTDESCRGDVIRAVCSQGKSSLKDAVKSLMEDPQLAKITSSPEKSAGLDAAIREDFFEAVNGRDVNAANAKFTSAADRCLNRQKYEEAAQFEKLVATPEFRARASAARRVFWTGVALQATSESLKKGLTLGIGYLVGKVSAPRTALSLSQYFWASVCSGGLQIAASFAKSVSIEAGSDACREIRKIDFTVNVNRTFSKECLNVYASSCSAAIGSVDLRNLGIQTDGQIANFVLDTANFGLWGLCISGGPGILASCGVINYAANQIGTAIKTGNNDLAQCVGTSQLGACIGQLWGQGGWTNKNGVESVRVEVDKMKQPWRVTGCCLCRKDFYRSQSYKTDPKTGSEWWLGVIQSGSVSGGNCSRQEAVRGEKIGGQYHLYRDCQKVDIVGAGCSLKEAGSNDVLQDVPRILWDNKTKEPIKVLRRLSATLD